MSKKSAGQVITKNVFASTLPKMVEISGQNGRLLQNSYFS